MQTNLFQLRDDQLLDAAKEIARKERKLQLCQIRIFSEIARRRLHLRAGYDSLFSYLVKELRYSKACAYQRSTIAKASGRWPEILEMIEDCRLSLAAASAVAKHLDEANGASLLQECAGKSKEEVELIVMRNTKAPSALDSIKPIGVRRDPVNRMESGHTEQPLLPIPIAEPPRPEDVIVKVSFATNARVATKLDRVKDLLARKHSQGALTDIFEELLDDYLHRHDPLAKAKRHAAKRQRSNAKQGSNLRPQVLSSYIPSAVKHHTVLHSEGGCTYISAKGVRCGSTRFLEYDHTRPFALGGSSLDPANIRLLCAAHNRERARLTFGKSG